MQTRISSACTERDLKSCTNEADAKAASTSSGLGWPCGLCAGAAKAGFGGAALLRRAPRRPTQLQAVAAWSPQARQ
jgi:hypothetical protein